MKKYVLVLLSVFICNFVFAETKFIFSNGSKIEFKYDENTPDIWMYAGNGRTCDSYLIESLGPDCRIDSVFTVVTYSELVKDSSYYCFDTTVVFSKINDLLIHADDYDVVELSWQSGSNTYSSLAFFNKLTGELEYDNMLYNMSTMSRYEKEGFSRALAMSESQIVRSGSDYASYKDPYNDLLLAKSGYSWNVHGTWRYRITDIEEDDDNYYYYGYSTFSMDYVDLNTIDYSIGNGQVYHEAVDSSVRDSWEYNFHYAIWAGPYGGFDILNGTGKPFHLETEQNADFQKRFTVGEGRIVHMRETIPPSTIYWISPKNN